MPNLPQKALITGASSGIGKALCRLLASKGISLLITGRRVEPLNLLAEELREHVPVILFTADLASAEGRKCAADKIHEHQPDLVVNNAGFGLYGEAVNCSIKDQLEIAEVNGLAVLELTLEAVHMLVKANKKGTVLNVSSAAAFQVFPELAVYSASKAFVNQFSESLDYELRSQEIRVLTACPGMVNTEFRMRASRGGSASTTTFGVMSASFAAEQLWQQVENQKTLRIFDWKTRLGLFFSRYLLPKALVAKFLASTINKRI